MKNKSLKNICVAVLVLATAGHTGIASALPYAGALGTAAGATDVWTAICPATTARLETKILDRAPVMAPLVSVQVVKGIKATNSTDPVEDAVYGPLVGNTGSAGAYYVFVDKTSAGAELYTVDITCRNSSNVVLTATSVKLTQDK